VPVAIGLSRVRRPSDGFLEKSWKNCSNSLPVLRILVASVFAAGLAATSTPASAPTRTVPQGVSIAGVRVGGLSAEPARARIETAFARSIRVTYQGKNIWISPESLGAGLSVSAAVSSALAATPQSHIALPVRYSRARLDRTVAALAKRFDRPAVDATVVGASSSGPEFSQAKAGLAVDVRTMRAALAELLRDGTREPLTLLTHPVAPKRTEATFGPIIIVTRGVNTLRLYDGPSLVRTFPVATGQAIYPTPAGLWRIMDKQRNPWWYPPTTSAWAKGLKPVPPGPSNPLGTRWMGLDAAGVGIHGTTAPTSIGYSVSHGCIRMQVPDAEWLFERVNVGTPVVIL
jgi:lipoprotein-anchoring transpeptidase ErfK/SrfK